MSNERSVEIIVRIKMDADADVQDVISEMDYAFTHPAIKNTEIVDIVKED